MSTKIKIAILSLCLVAFIGYGQQNYFNIPSSEITRSKKLFAQEQINLNKTSLQSNLTMCYGLPNNFEIGANVLNVDFEKQKNMKFAFSDNNNNWVGPVSPEIFINSQKGFFFGRNFELGTGFQMGIPYLFHNNFDCYVYSNLDYYSEELGLKITAGGFYANNNYLGRDSSKCNNLAKNLGFQGGIEKYLIEKKLSIMADHMSGRHSLGQSTIGFAWYLPYHFILSMGAQIANYKSKAGNGFIVEFTIAP